MKISVIIPVYNVSRYLPACVDSVLGQSYSDMEVILVDDGSPDHCGDICDAYSRKDQRIRVIHKKNGGLSDARNAGVDAATGDFVIFLDGDDLWADPQALTKLIERWKQTNADVVNYSYVRWFEDTGKKIPYFLNVKPMPMMQSKVDQLAYLTAHGLYIASACNKLIRRSVLDGLRFQKGVYSEDIEWCAQLMQRAGSMDFICENFYLYRQHSASIRHTINKKKCEDLADNILACFALIEGADEQIREPLLNYAAFQYGTYFAVQAQAEEVPLESITKLKDYRWILNYHGKNKKLTILHIGCKILGYDVLCKVIRSIYRIRSL